MPETFDHHPSDTIAHFREHGWMRLPQAFGAEAAAAMCDAVWRTLAKTGIQRDRPSTWTVERPAHLQQLKHDPVFQAVGSAKLLAAIDAVLEGRPFEIPKDWGAFFLAFPGTEPWGIPTTGWHIDANYIGPLWPAGGVKTFTLLADVVPRGGGTLMLGGSHRLVRRWFTDNPPPPDARGADTRRLLQQHPYIGDLHGEGNPAGRIARFMNRVEEWDGIPLQVIETTGAAGDIYLVHPLTLHVASSNIAAEPRFLLSGGVTTDMWGWGG